MLAPGKRGSKVSTLKVTVGECSSSKISCCAQLGWRVAAKVGSRLTRGCAQVFCGNAAKSIGVWEPPAGEMQERVVLNGHCGWVRALAVEGRWLFRRALAPDLAACGAVRCCRHLNALRSCSTYAGAEVQCT